MLKKVKHFGGDIWSAGKRHNGEAEWLKDMILRMSWEIKHLQERVVLSGESIAKKSRKMPNWKASRKDGVQGYWIKNISNLHERIAVQTNKILEMIAYLHG